MRNTLSNKKAIILNYMEIYGIIIIVNKYKWW